MSAGEFWVGPPDAPDTFRLVALLGAGGEGEVWRAVLPLSASGRRTVAVKIAHPAWDDPDREQRLQRLGHLLRSLSHPGLVRVTDVFVGPAKHREGKAEPRSSAEYVVMDFIDGPTLREWCDENPDATASQRLRMLRTVAAALDEMHSGAETTVPVAHGDVKPSNIVVRDGGAGTVLVDLGLTRLVDATGVSGRSAPYAAPELRVLGAQASPAGDRFAFAVTAAHVLVGQPPPTGPDGWLDERALQALLRAAPATRRRPQLVRQVMAAITAPEEARPGRLQSWLDDAADSLSQVTDSGMAPAQLGEETVAPVAAMIPPPPPVPARRSRGPWIALAAVAALVVVGVVLFQVNSPASPTTVVPGQTTTEMAEPPPVPPVTTTPSADEQVHTGSVDGLEPPEGYDFEFGERHTPEDYPGLDISGRSAEYGFDSLATTEGGRLSRLPAGPGEPGKADCDRLPDTAWTKNVPGVPVGRSVCVRTSEGNIAILTITKAWTGPSEEQRKIGFTYRIWGNI
ncbi:serine/threonine-protein kinase [Pseudonocardia sp. TRM90224]|uniref:serine/threonine-protein kinase n=1 Tax=Pseudonocardia sp. TRM90224 TaxID=2812678 RepID=UPI001E2CA4EE|nr:serine/threonine-protein kinase [Pseudonocardia sp. TRM90224]